MTNEQVDTHDPASMAAFLRERAKASRHFLTLTSEEQIRQFMQDWQKNVLPHFAFRFEQAAEMVERLNNKVAALTLLAYGTPENPKSPDEPTGDRLTYVEGRLVRAEEELLRFGQAILATRYMKQFPDPYIPGEPLPENRGAEQK